MQATKDFDREVAEAKYSHVCCAFFTLIRPLFFKGNLKKNIRRNDQSEDILLESHCEHHMVPILGKAHVAYLPDKRVVGLSKLARVVDLYAKRLQTQETMTAQIADTINEVLKPKGVAVVIDAEHQCMSSRGVSKKGTSTVTSRMLGAFRDSQKSRMEFMNLIAL